MKPWKAIINKCKKRKFWRYWRHQGWLVCEFKMSISVLVLSKKDCKPHFIIDFDHMKPTSATLHSSSSSFISDSVHVMMSRWNETLSCRRIWNSPRRTTSLCSPSGVTVPTWEQLMPFVTNNFPSLEYVQMPTQVFVVSDQSDWVILMRPKSKACLMSWKTRKQNMNIEPDLKWRSNERIRMIKKHYTRWTKPLFLTNIPPRLLGHRWR